MVAIAATIRAPSRSEVEVDTGEVKIMGSKSRLLQALVAGSGGAGGARTKMMSTIASLWRYDTAAFCARDQLEHATAYEA